MKFVCDNCQARYFLEDSKVTKGRMRFRCRRCDHVVVVQPLELPSPPTDPVRASMSPDDVLWYYAVNGQSFGPFDEDDLIAKFLSGQIGDEAHVWNRQLERWKGALEVPVFAPAIAEGQKRHPRAKTMSLEPIELEGPGRDREAPQPEGVAASTSARPPRPKPPSEVAVDPTERLNALRERLLGGVPKSTSAGGPSTPAPGAVRVGTGGFAAALSGTRPAAATKSTRPAPRVPTQAPGKVRPWATLATGALPKLGGSGPTLPSSRPPETPPQAAVPSPPSASAVQSPARPVPSPPPTSVVGKVGDAPAHDAQEGVPITAPTRRPPVAQPPPAPPLPKAEAESADRQADEPEPLEAEAKATIAPSEPIDVGPVLEAIHAPETPQDAPGGQATETVDLLEPAADADRSEAALATSRDAPEAATTAESPAPSRPGDAPADREDEGDAALEFDLDAEGVLEDDESGLEHAFFTSKAGSALAEAAPSAGPDEGARTVWRAGQESEDQVGFEVGDSGLVKLKLAQKRGRGRRILLSALAVAGLAAAVVAAVLLTRDPGRTAESAERIRAFNESTAEEDAPRQLVLTDFDTESHRAALLMASNLVYAAVVPADELSRQGVPAYHAAARGRGRAVADVHVGDGAPDDEPDRRARRSESDDEGASAETPAGSEANAGNSRYSRLESGRTVAVERDQPSLVDRAAAHVDEPARHSSRIGPDYFAEDLPRVSRAVQQCHRRHLQAAGSPLHRVELEITVQPGGEVVVEMDDQLADTAFGRCMQTRYSRWQFRSFEGEPVTLQRTYAVE